MSQSTHPARITVAVLGRDTPDAPAGSPAAIKAFWDKVHRHAS